MSIYINKEKVLTDQSLQVGGTNLLRGTKDGTSFVRFVADKNANANSNLVMDPAQERYTKTQVYHVWAPSLKNGMVVYSKPLYLTKGYYTFSFKGRNNGHNGEANLVRLYSNYTDSHKGQPLATYQLSTRLESKSMTFYLPEDADMGSFRLGDWSNDQLPGGSLYYADLKLERGTVATDWSPAPEDIYDEIQALKSQFGGVNNPPEPRISLVYTAFRKAVA